MKGYLITLGSVTYALKGRDLLRKNGFEADVEKTASANNQGCGYAVLIYGNLKAAEQLLKSNGIKILKITEI